MTEGIRAQFSYWWKDENGHMPDNDGGFWREWHTGGKQAGGKPRGKTEKK